jgi:hypothetical protein
MAHQTSRMLQEQITPRFIGRLMDAQPMPPGRTLEEGWPGTELNR